MLPRQDQKCLASENPFTFSQGSKYPMKYAQMIRYFIDPYKKVGFQPSFRTLNSKQHSQQISTYSYDTWLKLSK